MNLTDLQIELRNMETQIELLHNEIEKMKPQDEEEKRTEFEEITRLAKKAPIVNSSILNASAETKQLIFSSFAYLLLAEENNFYCRLLYLCRLANGCDFHITAEELYKRGLEFDISDIDNLYQHITDCIDTYLVEAIIIANISERASTSIFSIIADIANDYEISKEEIQVLGMTAKGILMNDREYILKMPVPSKNMWSGRLGEYFDSGWLEEHRNPCGHLLLNREFKSFNFFINLSGKMPCKINHCVSAGKIVRKGDVLCVYTETLNIFEKKEQREVKKQITAPCNGIVFLRKCKSNEESELIIGEYLDIYVVPYFDDYAKFCAWLDKKYENNKNHN